MLNGTSPHFIRCIKPNEFKLASKFSDDFVTRQLRYTGMLETTRIRREGYSHRPFYSDFVRQYIALAWTDPSVDFDRRGCEVILKNAKIEG
jgi:myosin-3